VLDVARVGSGRGPDVALLAEMRRRFAHLELIAGGGVRSREDLEQLGDVGCDGALVATALHEGRVTAAGVAALLHRRAGRPS
jgi:phosphoribosylformimino-5-aminoimidazole carboxamide ribotide isomerase